MHQWSNIGKTFRDGIDFYFLTKQHALRFVTFLEGHVPIQSEYVPCSFAHCTELTIFRYSRKLIGADKKSNIGNYKHNFLVLIAPICKVCNHDIFPLNEYQDDLVVLPRPLASNLSDINPLVLVKTVGSGIHIIDPSTAEVCDIFHNKFSFFCRDKKLAPKNTSGTNFRRLCTVVY